MKKLIYRFHCLGFRKKLIFSFIALVIIPSLISILFSYRIVNGILLEKVSNASLDSLDSATKRVDRLMDDITYSLLSMSSNKDLRSVLISNQEEAKSGGKSMDSREIFEKSDTMNNIFDKAPLAMIMYSSYITVLSDNDVNYGNWDGFNNYVGIIKKSGWFPDLMKSYSNNVLWIGTNKSLAGHKEKDFSMLEAAIGIKEDDYSSHNIGVIHIGVPEKAVYDILKSGSLDSEVFLVDSNGEIMSSGDKSLLTHSANELMKFGDIAGSEKGWSVETESDNRKVIVTYTTTNKAGWKVISITPYDTMFSQLYNIRNFIITVGALSIIAFIAIAFIISTSISKPIIYLSEKMKKVEAGRFDDKVDILYEDEIGNLGRSFNRMLDKVCDLMGQIKEQEKKKREAEFDALQAQINPHFLFNTLSSIRWAAAANDDSKVESMVLALSNLLKMSIGKGPDLITVEDEIANLMYYIDLCKMKQGFSFEVIADFDPRILRMKIPKLLFQPIVENSIIHGFEEKKEGGVIRLTGEIAGDDVKIYFEDNGKGIDPDLLRDIIGGKLRNINKNRHFRSIGINNIDERIKLNYGEKYGLELHNGLNGGTIVTMVIPYTEEADDAENHAG